MNNATILTAASLLVGVAGGIVIGKNSGSQVSGLPQSSANRVERHEGRNVRPGDPVSRPSRSETRDQGVKEISRLPGRSGRIQSMVAYYHGLSADQLKEEAGKLDDLPMSERAMASMLLFGRWGEVDARSAMDFVNGLGFDGLQMRPVVLQSWASVDPVNAAKYYEQNPSPLMMMGVGMVGGGRRGPMEFLHGGATIIAAEWAKQDPQAALAWANSLQQGKDGALAAVRGEMGRQDPTKAVGSDP